MQNSYVRKLELLGSEMETATPHFFTAWLRYVLREVLFHLYASMVLRLSTLRLSDTTYWIIYLPYSREGAITDFSLIDTVIPQLVSEEQNVELTRIPSSDEIKQTLFSMDADSAPGPDGFGGTFYHTAWPIIEQDITRAISNFFQTGNLTQNLNSNFLTLIPKTPGANKVELFRPIVLGNFLFKAISKLLASIVSPASFEFIGNVHDMG